MKICLILEAKFEGNPWQDLSCWLLLEKAEWSNELEWILNKQSKEALYYSFNSAEQQLWELAAAVGNVMANAVLCGI